MAVEVILPKVDMDMDSAVIESWKVKDGDVVEKGDVLFEIITSKAAMEVDSPAAGIVGGISGPVGEPIAVGEVVAFILQKGESPPHRAQPKKTEPAQGVGRMESAAEPSPAPAALNGGGRRATPLARRTARNFSIDLAHVSGTGPRGRISAEDVRRASLGVAAPRAGEGRLVPLSPIERIAAMRLQASKKAAPHFYMTADIEMTALNDALVRARAESPDMRPGLTLLIACLVARVLTKHPRLAASLEDHAVRLRDRIDIAIAMDHDGVLMTPVLRDLQVKSLADATADFERLKAAIRDRSAKPSDLTGAAFSISNLGMYGVDAFTAIINPPQSAILAIGRTEERPVVRDGRIVARPMATLSLSSDHRLVDGATAARFMADLRAALEAPTEL